MNFIEAVETGFHKILDFETRASPKEFWYWTLFYCVMVALYLSLLYFMGPGLGMVVVAFLGFLVLCFLGIATISLWVRRLHDLNRSGWWVLVALVPAVGTTLLVIFLSLPGTVGPNRFGNLGDVIEEPTSPVPMNSRVKKSGETDQIVAGSERALSQSPSSVGGLQYGRRKGQ